MKQAVQVRDPTSILPLMQRWKRRRQENFLIITLNGSHEVIKVHHISMGLVNRTIVHPRECFYHAVKDMAVAVIFIHNHPSGSTNASPEDDEVTERMSMASEIMGFNFLDHIIITPQEDYFSYRQAGKMPNKHEGYELEAFVKSLSNHYGDTPNSYQGEQHEQLELYFN